MMVYSMYVPADSESGVAGSVPVGLVHKHQLIAGVGEPCAQQLLKEPKHLQNQFKPELTITQWLTYVDLYLCTYRGHVVRGQCIYLMNKLDCVLEDGEEPGKTEVGHLLHDWIRVHLKTPTNSPVYIIYP